jgi:hypothetical protein
MLTLIPLLLRTTGIHTFCSASSLWEEEGQVLFLNLARAPKDMTRVTITPARKGYFLTIKDPEFEHVENTWAVTDGELKELYMLLIQMYS